MYIAAVFVLVMSTSSIVSGLIDSHKLISGESHKCETEKKLFWKVYLEHFRENNVINIILLNKVGRDILLKEFTNNILKFVYSRKLFNFNGMIKEETLINRQYFHRKSYRTHEKIHDNMRVIQPNYNIGEWTRIMYYSTEPQYVYVLIVWDENDLQEFLDVHPTYVLPNTRAMYLILFAYNLKENCLDWKTELTQLLIRLWEKFNVLNVVAHAPCSCTPSYVYTYKPFERIENEWGLVKAFTLQELKREGKVLLNSLKNLNFANMNVSIFERLPTAVDKLPVFMTRNHLYQNLQQSNGFSGMDGAILQNLAKYMNFKANFVKVGSINFGSSHVDGTVDGTMGDVVMKRSQISLNGRFLKDYNNSGLEFTLPYFNDPVCVLIHHADVIPKWKQLCTSFGIYSWICMGAIVLIAELYWYQLASRYFIQTSRRGWLYIFPVFMSSPLSVNLSSSQKIFLGSCLFYTIIMTGIFQGNLVNSYSTVSYYKEIQTLQELVDGDYKIATSLDVFKDDHTEIIRKLNQNSIYDFPGRGIASAAINKKIATLERKRDAEFLIKINYTNIDGTPSLHIVDECPISYFIACIVPKGSPFLHRFNMLINSFLENGLIPYWYKTMADNLILDKAIHTNSPSLLKRPFSMEDVKSAFFLLLIGLTGSIMVFFVEVYNGCSRKRKA